MRALFVAGRGYLLKAGEARQSTVDSAIIIGTRGARYNTARASKLIKVGVALPRGGSLRVKRAVT